MTTDTLLVAAIFVFMLMVVGLILTMREFTEVTEDPSLRKDSENAKDANRPPMDSQRTVASR